jgi:MATE family multidrug resistance protein
MGSCVRAAGFLAYGQFSQIAILDCVLLAPLGATPLAAAGFAGSVLAPFFIVTTALALALAPLAARDDRGMRGRHLLECLRLQGALVGVSLVALVVLARHLDVFHQPADVAQAARPHVHGMMLSLPPLVVLATLREWAISFGHRGPPIAVAAIALVTKVALGLCLVRGVGPVPALGVVGASMSTVAAYSLAALLLIIDLARRGLFAGIREARAELAPLWRSEARVQGVPVAIQQLIELGAFYITGIMAGWLGAEALAAHSIALNVINGAALVSLALAQATAVDVSKTTRHGRALGASSRSAAFTLGVMAFIAVPIVLGRAVLFAETPAFGGLAIVLAFGLLADGVQMTLAGALRGLVDAKFIAYVTFACWGIVCVPLSYALGFGLHLGIYGIWTSLAATSLLAAVVLALRLRHIAQVVS